MFDPGGFRKLDLLVSVELSMTETSALAHYVLPALTAYEKNDASFFAWNFPEIYFMMRRPVCDHEGEGAPSLQINAAIFFYEWDDLQTFAAGNYQCNKLIFQSIYLFNPLSMTL